jgi:CheY-like chemotaxis protein
MRHVLVAVFDSAIMTMLSEVLEIEGYHVTQARDQDQLIAVLRSVLHPLVVLLDVWAIEGVPHSATSFSSRL